MKEVSIQLLESTFEGILDALGVNVSSVFPEKNAKNCKPPEASGDLRLKIFSIFLQSLVLIQC